jgi:nucleotide-binding universal stress UspA family protein
MKKILVPTDFSFNASNAVEYAAQISLALHCQLVLLHVITLEEDRAKAEEKLQIICAALRDSFLDINTVYRIVRGESISPEIISTAELYNVEMIVMGKKGISNFEKKLFGSNTATIIEKARCTVLSVPGNKIFAKPQRILFATNFEQEDLHAVLQILKIARRFGAMVIISHVLTEDSEEESETEKIQSFSRQASLLGDYPLVSYRLISENTVTMGLDALIEATNADVIAMRTHRRTFFEKVINPSITQKFVEESHIALLAFHSD